jgi:hypothetical protein
MATFLSPAPLQPARVATGSGQRRERSGRRNRQGGAAAVEFALIALFAFLPLLLAIIEAGRLFYVVTTTQEVTRRAARIQAVNWLSASSALQRYAVFRDVGSGTVTLPGGVEINSTDVRLSFYGSYADALSSSNPLGGTSPQANLANCLKSLSPCIRYVRATLQTASGGPVTYAPMTGWFDTLLQLPLPEATVIMPAEALGLL